ncbi:hypothetical protein E2C01_097048 [Portunus trituberculatus]|uniref:Uncharacterized protein n=1 Tax=Portunus trituberculatus TaxID=210409 RepID=A0A5B7K3K8_PORTR|nr:hypothetical protein [Portunus trituberculatus]
MYFVPRVALHHTRPRPDQQQTLPRGRRRYNLKKKNLTNRHEHQSRPTRTSFPSSFLQSFPSLPFCRIPTRLSLSSGEVMVHALPPPLE